ncbi:epoxide hydrolase [Dyella sp. GSA-30]|uniref:epoxide hydrolase family protein n=1 Tax=Dyella sp. GSA-30 TaxID=2994496 RepID=UPI00248FE783|nr:epoxide hydrolase [Dyella sp. GSA-30]BDU21144.1 multidrug MFS transporter [Dyella sp. GSA-30]
MSQQPEPFTVQVDDAVLADIAQRLDRTVWPDDPGNDDWSYGVNRAYLKSLVDYWRHAYDWRAVERRINAFPHYKVVLDGVPVHFMHVKGKGPSPMPLVLTHGWPWSFWDMHKVIEPLTDPGAHGGDPADAFDVVIPSLPGYGFSGPSPHAGVNFWRTADLWNHLMTDVLGYSRYATSGGDWGALVSSQLGHKYAERLYGVHLMHPMLLDQFNSDRPWDVTARSWDTGKKPPAGSTKFAAHFAVHVLDPQTLAYALTDSPVGLLAWLLERWRAWGDSHGDPERVFSREHMITNTMIYWVTGTAGSSMRAYADAARHPWTPSHDRQPVVEAPTGITFLGGENPPGVNTEQRVAIFKSGPRAQFFNTVYARAHETGGHFGYYENASAVIDDLRDMFRPMRAQARPA